MKNIETALSKQKKECQIHLYNLDNYYRNMADLIAPLFDVPTWAVFAVSRIQKVVDARKSFAYLLKEKTDLKLKEIGVVINVIKQDHTTALHAIETAKDLILTSDEFRAKINYLLGAVPYRKTGSVINSALAIAVPSLTSFQIAALRGKIQMV